MKQKENSRIRALVNPIVFSEVFNQPFYSADFLNSTEYFDVKEEDIEIKNTKEFDGVNAKISDMDVVLKIMDKDKFEYLKPEVSPIEEIVYIYINQIADDTDLETILSYCRH